MATIPLFPLNTVVFPGVVVPLHVFEERYRLLVADLLAIPAEHDRVFGIVAIREGYEVAGAGRSVETTAHRVGTLVQLGSVEAYDDGRFDIEVTGRQRFRVREARQDAGYLTADVELLPDHDEASALVEADRALATFREYRSRLSTLRGGPVLVGAMPRDPAYLSYSLAATCLLTLPQRQQLLEAPDAARRLAMVRRALEEEMRAMRALPSLPATEVARTRWSPN